MFCRLLVLIVFAHSSLFGFAELGLRTTIESMAYRAACEKSGRITFRVEDNAFAAASQDEPFYLRLRFDHGAVLCQTLVSESEGRAPILIPAALEADADTETSTLNLPADAVSIVRWKTGEPEIWLKITSSSSTWIRDGQNLNPPSPTRAVRFSIGVDSQTSLATNETLYQQQRANLPAAQQQGAHVGTEMRFDLRDADWLPVPAPMPDSILSCDIIAFHRDTLNVETSADFRDIEYGSVANIAFSGDSIIGRAVDDQQPAEPGASGIELSTTIRDIAVDHNNQATGTINFSVDSDDFADVTPQDPAYLRLRLDKGATLADSRVLPGPSHQAIYLPLAIPDDAFHYSVAAAADSLAVVRWVAGEHDLWLKISTPTSAWLRNLQTGELEAPNADTPVSFTIGVSAGRSSADHRRRYTTGKANLAHQTLNGPRHLAADTQLHVDLRLADLEAMPAPLPLSLLAFDSLALDHHTQGVETSIDPRLIEIGLPLDITFSADNFIGRGVADDIAAKVDLKGRLATVDYDRTDNRLSMVRFDITGDLSAAVNVNGEFDLTLPAGFTLAETLVVDATDAIQIALKVKPGAEAGVTMTAGADKVTLIRWIKGEQQIRFRIGEPTDTWLKQDGTMRAPSAQNQVRFIVGNSAWSSLQSFLPSYHRDLANLPANLKINPNNGHAQAVDTRVAIKMDRGEVGVGTGVTWRLAESGAVVKVGRVGIR